MTHYSANPIERKKRNLYINGKQTSLSLETYLWQALDHIALQEGMTIDDICSKINEHTDSGINLTTAIRFMAHKTISLREQLLVPHHHQTDPDKGQILAEDIMPFPSPFFTALESIQMIRKIKDQRRHRQNFDTAQDQKDGHNRLA